MKLIQPQLVTSEPTRRQKPDATRPVTAVEAVEGPRGTGSYSSSYSTTARLPGKYVEQNQAAIHAYLHTASLEADGGELIGVDTYA